VDFPINPRHPRSILPQNEFANSIIPVPSGNMEYARILQHWISEHKIHALLPVAHGSMYAVSVW